MNLLEDDGGMVRDVENLAAGIVREPAKNANHAKMMSIHASSPSGK